MIDISRAGFRFRGAPVTLMSEGVKALIRRHCETVAAGLILIFQTATDTPGRLDESGCIVQSGALGGVTVWVERFGCTFEDGRHEGGEWSVFLPSER